MKTIPKMKQTTALLLLALGFALASCVRPTEEAAPPAGHRQLTMTFPDRVLTQGVTRAKYPANDQEKALNTVEVYVFSNGTSNTPDKLLGTLPVTLASASTPGQTVGRVDLTDLDYGTYHLVAIANTAVTTTPNMPFADFCDVVINTFPTADNYFVMASAPEKFEYTAGVAPVVNPITLTRLAVRIDIKNEVPGGSASFALTHVRILNAVDRSYLIKAGNSQLIGTAGASDKNLDWVENGKTSGVYDTEMFAALYTFENDAHSDPDKQTYVRIRGIYNGAAAEFDIPFGTTAVARNTRYLVRIQEVEADKVVFDITVLDWNEGGTIPFDPFIPEPGPPVVELIQPIGWDDNVQTKALVGDYEGIKRTYAPGAPEQTYEHLEKITIPFWRHRFDFTLVTESETEIWVDELTDGQTLADDTWLSITGDGSMEDTRKVSSAQVGDKLQEKYRVVFEANALPNEEAREMTLVFRSKSNPDKKRTVVIRQQGMPDLMGRMSQSFLTDMNTLSPEPLTEENVDQFTPAYFQWGRNKAFRVGSASETLGAGIAQTSTRVFEDKYFAYSTNIWTGTVGTSQKWAAQVEKAKQNAGTPEYDNWVAYYGTNNGDPCPPGWHLPDHREWWSVALGHKARTKDGANTSAMFGSYDAIHFREDPTVATNVGKSYREYTYTPTSATSATTGAPAIDEWNHRGTQYFFTEFDSDVIYALKHVQTGITSSTFAYGDALKTAFKYEWLSKDNASVAGGKFWYVKITSRHIGEDIDNEYQTPDDLRTKIAAAGFWNDAEATYQTLLVPCYGTYGGGAAYSGYGTLTYIYTNSILQSGSARSIRTGYVTSQSKPTKPSGYKYPINYYVFSSEWSHGLALGMPIRCVRNATASQEVAKTFEAFPTN